MQEPSWSTLPPPPSSHPSSSLPRQALRQALTHHTTYWRQREVERRFLPWLVPVKAPWHWFAVKLSGQITRPVTVVYWSVVTSLLWGPLYLGQQPQGTVSATTRWREVTMKTLSPSVPQDRCHHGTLSEMFVSNLVVALLSTFYLRQALVLPRRTRLISSTTYPVLMTPSNIIDPKRLDFLPSISFVDISLTLGGNFMLYNNRGAQQSLELWKY